jgi:hypothetical protein
VGRSSLLQCHGLSVWPQSLLTSSVVAQFVCALWEGPTLDVFQELMLMRDKSLSTVYKLDGGFSGYDKSEL